MATRGTKVKSFKQENVWLNGPKFLLQHQSQWPKAPTIKSELCLNDLEIKSIMVNTLSINKILHPLCKLIGYYSSWDKLKPAVAWTLKVKETLIQLKDQRKELWNTLSNTEKDSVKLKTLVEQHMKQYKEKMRRRGTHIETPKCS